MWRFTRFNDRLNTLRVGLLATFALTLGYACSDSTGLAKLSTEGIVVIEYHYPDSIKNPPVELSATRFAPSRETGGNGISANLVAPGAVSLSTVATLPSYSVAAVPFAPEAAPTVNVPKICDDCLIANIPMGFNFTFFGQVYDKINIGTNGIVGFGRTIVGTDTSYFMSDGCCVSRFIAQHDLNNNVIALGWADWAPTTLKQIRYETRGVAPNRRFLIQFTNVGESGGNGHITAQLVLYESSNDIVLYTTELNTTFTRRAFTHGIENLAGTEAAFVAGRDSARFSLANDAVKFSVTATNKAPVITAPANLAVNTGPAVCAANVNVGAATATDDAPGVTVSGVRSDGLGLDAAYPKGVTTITWTATDIEKVFSSATQTVTVNDKENPSVVAPESKSVRANKGVSYAIVDVGTATAADNCPNVTVSGARSDNAPLVAGYPLGVTTITWTAKDAVGNLNTATQTVSVRANQPPVFPTVPPAIAVSTDPGVCLAVLNPVAPIATDDLPGVLVKGVRNDTKDVSGPYPKGLTVITWTATDVEDATASVTQSVTVSDKEKPSIVAPANISVGNDPDLATATVAVGNPEAKDNCVSVSVSSARSDGLSLTSPYPIGSTTITWKATDPSLNFSSATQTVVVGDVTPPKMLVPASFSANATTSNGAAVSFVYSATDNVGVTSVGCSPMSGSQFPIGPTTVSCTASDAAGNKTSASFVVTVLGAHDQLVDLIAYVRSLGLPNGTGQPLLNQLEAALRALNGNSHVSCVKLSDFIGLASAKASKANSLDTQAFSKTSAASYVQRAQMAGDAQRICSVLGCG